MMSVNTTLAPIVASLWARRDRARLQQVISKDTRVTFAISLVVWLGLMIAGRWLLAFLGPEFVKAYPAMMILSTGLVLCTLAAAVGLLLSMTGHERVLARLSSSAAILNVVLCALLIPRYSVEGAAAATALSTLYVNVAAVLTVYRVVGVNPSV